MPAFVVFTDATLQLIAEHKPQSAQALLRINGIGQAKLDKYGEDVLGAGRLSADSREKSRETRR